MNANGEGIIIDRTLVEGDSAVSELQCFLYWLFER